MGNYAPVQVEIWNHPKFQRLATHPLGDLRLAALYVLTTPYRNYLTGFYRIKLADITDHLACTDSHARAVIEALTAESWIRYDYENKVLLVLDHLEHNPMGGSKQLTSAVDHVKTLRHSPLLGEFVEASRRYAHKCPGLYDALIGAFGPQPEPAPPPSAHAPATPRPERDTAPPSPRPAHTDVADPTEAFRALQRAHEQHSGRLLTTDDTLALNEVLKAAAEAGVEWQVLLRLMIEAQENYKGKGLKKHIERIRFYFSIWDPYIREAREELGQRRPPAGLAPPPPEQDPDHRRPLDPDHIE